MWDAAFISGSLVASSESLAVANIHYVHKSIDFDVFLF